MLSDRERETLREIQRQFLIEDPDLVRSFDRTERAAGERSRHERQRSSHTVWIVLALVCSTLTLAMGLPGTALVFVAGAALIAVHRRYRDDLPRRET